MREGHRGLLWPVGQEHPLADPFECESSRELMIMDSFGRYVVETIHDHGITQPKPAPLSHNRRRSPVPRNSPRFRRRQTP